MSLPTDYTDAVTPTGATTEYPATTTRGLNATHTAVNAATNYLNGTTANATLKAPTVTGYVESVQTLGTLSTGTTVLALTNGTVITATLTASNSITFTMPTATAGTSFICLIKQAASTGNATVTFTGVKWPASGTPTMTATAGKLDIFSFIADGSAWYGAAIQGYTY